MAQKNAITQAAEETARYQKKMTALLDTPELQGLHLGINASITQLQNKLNHMSGQAPVAAEAVKDQFPPITNFMGEELVLPKQLNKDSLTPQEAERSDYLKRVDALENEFPTLAHEGILNGYTTPEDQLVVRGVAKRAGLDNYRDGAIDAKFLEQIQTGLNRNADDKRTQAEIDKQLKK